MAEAWNPLFSSIIHSTIWDELDHVRLTWVTMIAMAGRDGVVRASVPGLAHAARLTIEQVQEALSRFVQPDPFSRTPDNDGRRIESVDGGWLLLNHPSQREKALNRERQARFREKQRNDTQINGNAAVTDVTDVTDVTQQALQRNACSGSGSGSGSGSEEGGSGGEGKGRGASPKHVPARAPKQQPLGDLSIPTEAWELMDVLRALLLQLNPEHPAGGKRWGARATAQAFAGLMADGAAEPIAAERIEAVLRWHLGGSPDSYWHSRLSTGGQVARSWGALSTQYDGRNDRRTGGGRNTQLPPVRSDPGHWDDDVPDVDSEPGRKR